MPEKKVLMILFASMGILTINRYRLSAENTFREWKKEKFLNKEFHNRCQQLSGIHWKFLSAFHQAQFTGRIRQCLAIISRWSVVFVRVNCICRCRLLVAVACLSHHRLLFSPSLLFSLSTTFLTVLSAAFLVVV